MSLLPHQTFSFICNFFFLSSCLYFWYLFAVNGFRVQKWHINEDGRHLIFSLPIFWYIYIIIVTGLRLLPHQRNTWLRKIYCLQTVRQLLWDFPVLKLNVLHPYQQHHQCLLGWLWPAQTSSRSSLVHMTNRNSVACCMTSDSEL